MRNVLLTLLSLALVANVMSAENVNVDFFTSSNWIKSAGVNMNNEYNYPKSSHPFRNEEWISATTNIYSVSSSSNFEVLDHFLLPSDMPSNYQAVFEFAFDNFGNIWMAHHEGVTRYNEKTKTWKHYTDLGLGSQARARRIQYDSKHKKLMVGTIDGFVSATINPDGSVASWNKMLPDSTDKTVHCIGYYNDEMWAQNTKNIYHYVDGKWTGYSAEDLGAVTFVRPATAFVDKNGDCWTAVMDTEIVFNSKYRLAKFEHSSGSWKSVQVEGVDEWDPHSAETHRMANGIYSIAIDRNGVMWLSGVWSLMKVNDLAASKLTVKYMTKWDNGDLLNTDYVILGLNPASGLKVSARKQIEDTTGLGAYYASVSSVRQPFIRNLTIARNKGQQYIGTFSLDGRRIAKSNPALSAGNYLQMFRTAEGQNSIVKVMSLTANPSHN